MLRFLILVAVFAFVVTILYRVVKRLLMSINNELEDDDNLEDRAMNMTMEGDKFDADLKRKQKDLQRELRMVNRLKGGKR